MIYTIFLQLALLLFFPGLQPSGARFDTLIGPVSASGSAASQVAASAPRLPAAAPVISSPRKLRPESLGVEVTAKSALVLDPGSGEILFAKEPDLQMPVASLTKLASALVFLETKPEWKTPVVIAASDLRGGGVEYLIPGESVSVGDLFLVALVGSSNTAIAALARFTGLSPEEFVARMNAKAASLGLKNTRFTEPTGLDPGNVGTAREMATLAQAAFLEPRIREAVTAKQVVVRPMNPKGTRSRTIRSTDALLSSFLAKPPYVLLGGKTGSLGNGVGNHFVMSLENGESRPVIVVVLGSESNVSRFQDAKSLAVWTFDTWSWK